VLVDEGRFMRQLTPHQGVAPRRRGLSLIELMVAFAIISLLALAAAPYMSDYGVNARLRESGNTLFAEALFAQSEAIKRNNEVRLATAGGVVTVSDLRDPANPVVLRTRTLGADVSAENRVVTFSSQGSTAALAAAAINLSHALMACSGDHRCPGLRVEAGGAIRLCGNHLVNCT
jgi:type IV fimbrial biogenesis protein FimT